MESDLLASLQELAFAECEAREYGRLGRCDSGLQSRIRGRLLGSLGALDCRGIRSCERNKNLEKKNQKRTRGTA